MRLIDGVLYISSYKENQGVEIIPVNPEKVLRVIIFRTYKTFVCVSSGGTETEYEDHDKGNAAVTRELIKKAPGLYAVDLGAGDSHVSGMRLCVIRLAAINWKNAPKIAEMEYEDSLVDINGLLMRNQTDVMSISDYISIADTALRNGVLAAQGLSRRDLYLADGIWTESGKAISLGEVFIAEFEDTHANLLFPNGMQIHIGKVCKPDLIEQKLLTDCRDRFVIATYINDGSVKRGHVYVNRSMLDTEAMESMVTLSTDGKGSSRCLASRSGTLFFEFQMSEQERDSLLARHAVGKFLLPSEIFAVHLSGSIAVVQLKQGYTMTLPITDAVWNLTDGLTELLEDARPQDHTYIDITSIDWEGSLEQPANRAVIKLVSGATRPVSRAALEGLYDQACQLGYTDKRKEDIRTVGWMFDDQRVLRTEEILGIKKITNQVFMYDVDGNEYTDFEDEKSHNVTEFITLLVVSRKMKVIMETPVMLLASATLADWTYTGKPTMSLDTGWGRESGIMIYGPKGAVKKSWVFYN